MKHALVVGGTGMLSEVSIWLVKEGYHISVIGRNPERMNRLKDNVKDVSFITPILVDYHQEDILSELIQLSLKKNGQVDIVVAWVHSNVKDALNEIVREAANPKPWRLFHVLGSRANIEDTRKNLTLDENCLYRQVQLGFIVVGEGSRWLTNEEIANGVIDSIKSDESFHLVGVLEPAQRRPI